MGDLKSRATIQLSDFYPGELRPEHTKPAPPAAPPPLGPLAAFAGDFAGNGFKMRWEMPLDMLRSLWLNVSSIARLDTKTTLFAEGSVRNCFLVGVLLIASGQGSCPRVGSQPNPPVHPVHDISYKALDTREHGLFLNYPHVTAANAKAYWLDPLNLSQRVEFAGGLQAIQLAVEKADNSPALIAVTNILGSDPSASSEQQFNNEVIWEKDAAARIKKLPHWSEHIALLHPGQCGYQENRDGNPFLGLVVLFDTKPANPMQPGGQFHIGFRPFFGHYEAENGDIGNAENYKLYTAWYGYIGDFVPLE